VLLDEQLPDGFAWGLFLLTRMGEGEATFWVSNAAREGMLEVVRGWLAKQQSVPQPGTEPEWLGRLRLALGKFAGGTVMVKADDLLEAVGAAAPGPGAVALVGLDPEAPLVMVDYRTLVRFVRFSETEARGMAGSLLRKAELLAGRPELERAAVLEAVRTLEAWEGRWACEGGPGHDDPDGSGICIRCKGISDGSAPSRSAVVAMLRALGSILPESK